MPLLKPKREPLWLPPKPTFYPRRKLPDARFPHIWVPRIVPIRGAVAFDAKSEVTNTTTSASPLTYSGHTVGAALTNGILIAGFAGVPVTTLTGLAATWNGVSMFHIGGLTQSATYEIHLWGLQNPAAGNKSLVISWTAGTINPGSEPACISFSGGNQTGGTTTFKNFNSTTGSSAGPNTLAVNTAVGDATVAFAGLGDANGTYTNNAGTLWFNDGSQAGVGLGAIGSYNLTASGTSFTYSFTQSTNDFFGIIGCDIVAASGGGAVTPSRPNRRVSRRYY